ncbi:tRNA pseudouridine(38-40) synthase TruA [Nocardioides hungaricus]
MRIRLDLAYDGSGFHGWAAQPGLRTVQGELTLALATVLRVPSVDVVCAGRTDAGVHARGQVVHLDVEDPPEPELLARRANGVLAPDARIHRATAVPAAFDARFGALWRRYAYRIADRPSLVDPLTRSHVLAWPRPLDEAAMNAASLLLVGRHDFASFCRQRAGATTIRTLEELSWSREGSGVLVGTVRADAFCHSMVRSLVGCLIAIGEGRRPVDWAGEILAAAVRDPAVAVVHAHGLTLEEVAYPPDDELAARAAQTRARRVADG